jgi:hypothetical protein
MNRIRHGIFSSQNKGLYTLNFSDTIAFDFLAETNTQTIPSSSTLHATVSISSGETTVFWDVFGSDTQLWNGSSYSNQTLSFSADDILKFIFVSFGGSEGGVVIRLTNASGPIVSSFSFFLTG